MTTPLIRPATPGDAASLAEIIHLSLGDTPTPGDIAQRIQATERLTLVVQEGPALLGFVDGFFTQAVDGSRRFELDLLAVAPRVQGRGLGRWLIGQATTQGLQAEAALARGLVAINNIPSQRAFAHAGYAPEPYICALVLLPPILPQALAPYGHLVPVTTLTYSGHWLEAPRLPALIQDFATLPHSNTGQTLGMVIPQSTLEASALHGIIQVVGLYTWWIRTPAA